MIRKEQVALSILKNLELANGRFMREEILHRIVMLELAYMKASTTEIKQALEAAEMRGTIASDLDDYGNVSFVLTQAGKAELLARG